jgi:surface polysaccharide O-acyltransferase-like enzyme
MIHGKSKNTEKIVWISVLQGWSMLLVIMGHIALTNEFRDPDTPVSAEFGL